MLSEKSVSKSQQRFMGAVRRAQKGEGAISPKVAKAAREMTKGDVHKFAATKHEGLPERVPSEFEQKLDMALFEIAAPLDRGAIAAKFGREKPLPGTTITDIDPKDLGTALLFRLRKEFPEAEFYQPGSRIGSPVYQINDRVSYCVLFINGRIVDIGDHEDLSEEPGIEHRFNMASPDSLDKLLDTIRKRVKPYRKREV